MTRTFLVQVKFATKGDGYFGGPTTHKSDVASIFTDNHNSKLYYPVIVGSMIEYDDGSVYYEYFEDGRKFEATMLGT